MGAELFSLAVISSGQAVRMNFRTALLVSACALACLGTVFAFQKPFREYLSEEGYNDFPKPPDYQDKTDFVFARMMYPQGNWGIFGGLWRYNHKEGNSAWTDDYPRSDRHFVLGCPPLDQPRRPLRGTGPRPL